MASSKKSEARRRASANLGYALILLVGSVAAPRTYGWALQIPRKVGCCRQGVGAGHSIIGRGRTALRLHQQQRVEFLRSVVGGVVGGQILAADPLAAAAQTVVDSKKGQDFAAAKIQAGLNSLEREAKKIDKAVTKEAKNIDKAVMKDVKELKKEIKKADRTVTKEVKNVSKKVEKEVKRAKKEAKKVDKAVKKETMKAMKEVDKRTKVAERGAKKLGDTIDKGTKSLVGRDGTGGIDVSKLKICDDPSGKCL